MPSLVAARLYTPPEPGAVSMAGAPTLPSSPTIAASREPEACVLTARNELPFEAATQPPDASPACTTTGMPGRVHHRAAGDPRAVGPGAGRRAVVDPRHERGAWRARHVG